MTDQTLQLILAAQDRTSAAFKALQDHMKDTAVGVQSLRDEEKKLAEAGQLMDGMLSGLGVSVEEYAIHLERAAENEKAMAAEQKALVASLGAFGAGAAMGVAILGAITAGAVKGGEALVDMALRAASSGGQIADVMAKTGVSAQFLTGALALAAARSDASAQDIGRAVSTMQKAIVNESKAFKQLGLDVKDLKAERPEQAFADVARAILAIQNPTEQSAASMAVFKKSADEMLPALKALAAGAGETADAIHAGMTGEEVASLDKLDDSVKTLSLSWERLQEHLVAAANDSGILSGGVETLAKQLGALSGWVEKNHDLFVGMSIVVLAMADDVTYTKDAAADLFGVLEHAPGTIGDVIQFFHILALEAKKTGQDLEDLAQAQRLSQAEAAMKFAKNFVGPPLPPDYVAPKGPSFSKDDTKAADELAAATKRLADAQAQLLLGLDSEIAKIYAARDAEIAKAQGSEVLISLAQKEADVLIQVAEKKQADAAATQEAAQADQQRATFLAASTKAAELDAQIEGQLNELRAASLSPLDAQIEKINQKANAEVAASTNAYAAQLRAALANGQETESILRARDAAITRIQTLQDEATARAVSEEAKQQDLLYTQMLGQAEQSLAQAQAKGTGSLRDQIAAIEAATSRKKDAYQAQVANKKITQEEADELKRLADAEAKAQEQHAKWASLDQVLGGIVGDFQALEGLLTELGVSSDSTLGKMTEGLKRLGQAAQDGFKSYAQFSSGDIVGGIESGIKAIGGLVGGLKKLFGGKEQWEKDAEAIGRDIGEHLSKGLVENIEAMASKLNITLDAAALLNIQEIMDETGKSAHDEMENIQKLMQGVADSTIPAKQGIEDLGNLFGNLQSEAEAAGRVGDAALVQMIQSARQLGLEIPAITQAVQESLGKAVAAMSSLFGEIVDKKPQGGIPILTAEDAKAQADIFSTVFWSEVAEKGLLVAAEEMAKPFAALQAKLEALGGAAAAAILGPIQNAMTLIESDALRPIAEGIQGLSAVLVGLANSGYLTTGSFSALQEQAKSAFDQMVAGGADSQTALMAIAPLLGQLQSAAANTGLELDANTQALIAQAEAAGIAFSTDPMNQMVDILKIIAIQLGAELPAAAAKAGTAVKKSMGGIASNAVDALGNTVEKTAAEMAGDVGTAADIAEARWIRAVGGFVTDTEASVPLLQEAFDDLEGSAIPALQAVEHAINGINGSLSAIPGNAAEAGNALGGLAGPGNTGGGGQRGGPPDRGGAHHAFADEGVVPWSPGGRTVRVSEHTSEAIVSRETMADVIARAAVMTAAAYGGGNSSEMTLPIVINIGGDRFASLLAKKTKSGQWQVHENALGKW